VELWDKYALHIRWTVAAVGHVYLAQAAFDEAVRQWPDQRLTLRQGDTGHSGASRSTQQPVLVMSQKRAKNFGSPQKPLKNGALGAIRTPDPQIRSLMLYPAELRARWADNSRFVAKVTKARRFTASET
jgi:hypothetical protein